MSITTVIKNLVKKGLSETLIIRGIGHDSPAISEYREKLESQFEKNARTRIRAAESYYRKYIVAMEMAGHLETLGHHDDAGKAVSIAEEVLRSKKTADPQALEQIESRIAALETPEYREYIKAHYLKVVVPQIYDSFRKGDIEDKILFLQPRRTLNPSCKLLFNTLKKMGRSTVELHELLRWRVSITEEYLNLCDFIKEMATARAVVTHEFNEYFGYVDIRPETKMIQLWHGCGIIKCLGMDTCGMEGEEFKTEEEYEEYPEFDKYDLVTLPGEAERPIFESFMGRPEGAPELSPIGVSRTDVFFDDRYLKRSRNKLLQIIPQAASKKVILYAPTFRGSDPLRTAPDRLDIRKLADQLSDDYVLVLKYHQTIRDLPTVPEDLADSFAFDLTHGSGMDINELMAASDILISDYSSVVFEFSLFERPVLFFIYDYDEYRSSRSMYYTLDDIKEWGPVVTSNDEILSEIKKTEAGFDKTRISAFRQKYMNACDGHSTERIIQYIYES